MSGCQQGERDWAEPELHCGFSPLTWLEGLICVAADTTLNDGRVKIQIQRNRVQFFKINNDSHPFAEFVKTNQGWAPAKREDLSHVEHEMGDLSKKTKLQMWKGEQILGYISWRLSAGFISETEYEPWGQAAKIAFGVGGRPSEGVVSETEYKPWGRAAKIALGVGLSAAAVYGAHKAGAFTTVQRYVRRRRRH
jgi:hypothetical protein